MIGQVVRSSCTAAGRAMAANPLAQGSRKVARFAPTLISQGAAHAPGRLGQKREFSILSVVIAGGAATTLVGIASGQGGLIAGGVVIMAAGYLLKK